MPRRFKSWLYETGLFSLLLILCASEEGTTGVNATVWWILVIAIVAAYIWLAGPFVMRSAQRVAIRSRQTFRSNGAPVWPQASGLAGRAVGAAGFN